MAEEAANLSAEIQLRNLDPEPFLKWAGGKRLLVPRVAKYLPKKFGLYCEPFVGGGAFFFHLKPKRAILADVNSELVSTYRVVRDNPDELITALRKHFYDRAYYYEVRQQDPAELPAIDLAARMIYLNRVGFNGLYRVNSKGKFNVPFGRYTNPKIVNEANIRACSLALQSIIIEQFTFRQFPWEILKPHDFVYLDPPYVPLSRTSHFTDYSKEGFGPEEQQQLAELYRGLDGRGIQVMLSNSGTEIVSKLYKGYRIIECEIPRMINSKGDRRGAVKEFVVINY